MAKIESGDGFTPFKLVIETEAEAAILWAALNSPGSSLVALVPAYPYMRGLIDAENKKPAMREDAHHLLWELVDEALKTRNMKR